MCNIATVQATNNLPIHCSKNFHQFQTEIKVYNPTLFFLGLGNEVGFNIKAFKYGLMAM